MKKIWLPQYQQHVPAEIQADKYDALPGLIGNSCQQFAEEPAFSQCGMAMNYQQFEQYSLQFASYCQHTLRLTKGQRLAIMLPNAVQYPVVMYGALLAGLVIVNINPLYTPKELAYHLSDAEVSALVILKNILPAMWPVCQQTGVKNILTTEMGDLFPAAKKIAVNVGTRLYYKQWFTRRFPTEVVSLKDALEQGKREIFQPVIIEKDDLAFLQYTGGTTGVPKGAQLTHRNLLANIEQISAWFSPSLRPKKEVIVTAIPLYHVFALTANCLTCIKLGGHNVLIADPRRIHSFIRTLKRSRFTVMTGVNTLFNALLHHPQFRKLDFSTLKLAFAGGMTVQPAVADRWHQLTGKPLLVGYGLTETSPVVSVSPANSTAFDGSVGLPLPSTEVAIINQQDEMLGIGEEGEVVVKGPQVMTGYWKKPEETAEAFTAEGWFHTGDIGYLDDKGFLYLVDRKKDMILLSGFNVYPSEIESVLVSHPQVVEAGVIGVPSERTGEKVKAFVVKKQQSLTEHELIAYCREQLTHYKVPKEIVFVSALPKSMVGKILRRSLREGADEAH